MSRLSFSGPNDFKGLEEIEDEEDSQGNQRPTKGLIEITIDQALK